MTARRAAAVALLCASCAGAPEAAQPEGGRRDAGVALVDAGVAPPDAGVAPPDAGTALPEDDAEVSRVSFPATLACGESRSATVVVRNTGSATWTPAAGYKLGRVGDSEPLHPGDARVWLGEGESVPAGATWAF